MEDPTAASKTAPTEGGTLAGGMSEGVPSDDAAAPGPCPVEVLAGDGRRATRKAFPFQQRVAFGRWEGAPPEAAFVAVTFRDVSSSGCSFMLETRPEHDRLYVQLGTDAHRLIVEAAVVHATFQRDEFGETFLIGCRFLRRLE